MRKVTLDTLEMLKVAEVLRESELNFELGKFILLEIASWPGCLTFTWEFTDEQADQVERVHRLYKRYCFNDKSAAVEKTIARIKRESVAA